MNLNTTGYCFIVVVFFCLSCRQIDQPATTQDQTKLEEYRLKFNTHSLKNPDSALYYLNLQEALINGMNDPRANWEIVYDYCKHFFNVDNYASSKDYGKKAYQLAVKLADSVMIGRSLNMLGNVNHKLGNYAQALDHFYNAINIFRKIGEESRAGIPMSNIGLVYIDMREYEKAEKAFLESLEISKEVKDTFGLAIDYNHVGITLKKAQKYDEAREKFFLSLKFAEQLNDSIQIAIVFNNLGLVEAEEHNFSQAIKYLEESLAIKRQSNLKTQIAITANFLAGIHMKNGDLSKALALSSEALDISNQAGIKDQISKSLLNLSEVLEAEGDHTSALGYYKRFKKYEDSMFNEARARQIAEMEAIYESDKKEKQIAQLTIDRQEETLKRTWYVTTLSSILFLLLAFGLGMHYRNKKNRQLSETKLKSFELTLKNYTQNLLEKNERIEKLNEDLERARVEISNTCPAYNNTMDSLMQSTILTDDDWTRFKRLFLQAHPGFFNKLRKKFPYITQTEERLIALTKLSLKTKEIASMLGISAESVNKSRYRMRKKLGISSEEMEKFVSEF